jgi:hypothetical protein
LAILEASYGKSEDLSTLKDKVKEFQLYDIKVLKYDNLFINIFDFVKGVY